MTVGELVRTRRIEKGWTQTELAQASGLRQTYISQVEKGEIAMPRDHNLDALGAALGLTKPDFYRAAGMVEEVAPPREVTIQTRYGPITFDRAAAIAYVENKPDQIFRDQLARAKQRRSKAAYERWLLKIYTAWSSNADLAVDSLDLDDAEREA